ncbi:MAG: hypothetical protein ACYS9T_07485 [Planctomycetota bacterium]|jgi:hypothetical protein
MLEITQYFERMMAGLTPEAEIGLGVVCVIVGLFIWLGGLRVRKLLAAILGAAAGGICAYFLTGRNVAPAVVAAAVTAVLAVIFEKVFIIILTAGLASVFIFAVLAKLFHKVDFAADGHQAYINLPAYSWLIVAAPSAILVLAGVYLRRLTSAFCCAALGTIFLFAGMILLLDYKGIAPLESIRGSPPFYAAVFVAMTAFGTAEQLLLCRSKKPKSVTKKEAEKESEDAGKIAKSWRTS